MNDDLNRDGDDQLNERLLNSHKTKDLMRRFDLGEDLKKGEQFDNSPVLIKFASTPLTTKPFGGGGNINSPAFRSLNENTGSNLVPNKDLAKRFGSPGLDRLGSSHNSMQGSQKKDSFSAGLHLKGFGGQKEKSEISFLSQKFEQKRKHLTASALIYNSFENFVLFLMVLNSVIYPSASSALYFVFAMALTLMSLTRDQKIVQIKFIIGLVLLVLAMAWGVTKGVILVLLNNEGPLVLSSDERYLYDSLGIRIDQQMTRIKIYNTLMTISFDVIEVFLSATLSAFYFSLKKDCKKIHTADEQSAYLLHPFFEKHHEALCVFAIVVLSVSTIFVQTIIQAFVLILMLILFGAWAHEQHEKNSLRLLILNFAQSLMLIQIVIIFVFQVAIVSKELFITDFTFVWDMFGFLLHNLKLYQVILHLLTMSLSIQAIQMYKQTRASALKSNAMILPGDVNDNDENERLSDDKMFLKSGKKRFSSSFENKNKTFGSGMGRSTFKGSIVERFKEKTLELKHKQLNESSIMIVTKINYRHFSPQIWFFVCRFTAFVWCYAYHDFQSWVLLGWIMHSTLFQSMKRFYYQTVTYYLPFFVGTFIFYYIINIPRVVEFQTHREHLDSWLSLGFYQYSIPPVEISLMMLGLCPYFFLIKSKKYLAFNKEEQKVNFLETLTKKESPTVFYLLFLLITNLDLIVFLAIFFSGVNKIDFYHVFLLFFFVAYITAPLWFNKNYIYLLYYVTFFVFEKYLFTLIDIYIPQDGQLRQLLDVLGLSTDYDEKSDQKYFRYAPKLQQWGLILVVFFQYQVHKLLQDEKVVHKCEEEAQANFKERYPGLAHFFELLRHMKKEFLILLTFTVFFVIIIFSDKNIINWGFQIIICIFIIAYVGYGNRLADDTGINRLHRVWFLIIWYASFVLIVQITFQFAALPYVRKSLNLDYILDLLPLWVRKNLPLIGFKVYKTYIWQQFVIYLMYFAIGHYVRGQIVQWISVEKNSHYIEMVEQPHSQLHNNSDMVEAYIDNYQGVVERDWKAEFLKIRFSTPYLVYKLRKIWVFLDKCSQLIFVIISLIIMMLATHWQISLSMAIHLTCFLGLCLEIAQKLHENREKEKKGLKARTSELNHKKYRSNLTLEECQNIWDEYKVKVNNYQVKIRQNVWHFQFLITLLCITLIYPSEFIFYVRKTFNDEGDHPELVHLLDYITFYLFWIGVYHCPQQGHGYFYNLYGYLIILVLLIFEKNAQRWALNRFGCTVEQQNFFRQIEENLSKKPKSKQILPDFNAQIIEEDPENEDKDDSIINPRKKKHRSSHINSISKQQFNENSIIEERSVENYNTDPDEIKRQLKKWISKNYILKLLSGFKILLEETIQLLLLISSVYKDSVVGMVLLFGVFLYMIRRRIRTIHRLAWITGLSMIIQYGLALSNLTSANNPMQFPEPFDPYPSGPKDEGQFIIPWYLKIPFLADSFPWQIYLSMGVSNSKLNSIWIDYVIMGCIQAELFYFGCQLFSIELKLSQGNDLKEMFNRYTLIVSGNQLPSQVKKETKKLKRECFVYSFYKGAQMTMFMHFHQITILVTLLLAILARSLLSFGYITVCMIMIYENHKYFLPNQQIFFDKNKKKKNFPLHKVLKCWLQPYVFFDITIQMIYQVPLEFLHRNQDAPNSWQNIIGLQDIWVENAGQVTEVGYKSLVYIILKAFTYYFVALQIQVFESKSYLKYMNKDFKRYMDMAEAKGKISIWRANNFKIQQISAQHQEQNKMDQMLKNLKKVLTKWQILQNQDLHQQIQVVFDKEEPQLQTKSRSESFINNGSIKQKNHQTVTKTSNILEDEAIKQNLSVVEKFDNDSKLIRANTKQKLNLKSEISVRSSTFLPQISSNQNDLSAFKSEHQLLLIAISQLNIFLRILIWVKKNLTDQVVFISSKNYLDRVTKDMQQGKTNIYSKLERRMLVDIREIKESRKKNNLEHLQDIDIKDMKRTQQYIKFGKVLRAYIKLFSEILVSYSDSICYILMIVSMMKNAGLISIIYPFVVFGYALMEEINPKRKVWNMLMIYTQLLIIIKFIFQLSFWEAFYTQLQIDQFQDKINGFHVGLTRFNTDDFARMLAYFLPEILILLGIMSHIQKEIMTGVLFQKEKPVENIQEAVVRYMKQNKEIVSNKKQQSMLKFNDSLVSRNLIQINNNERLQDFNPDQFIISEMQSFNLLKDSIFYEEVKILRLQKRSKSFSTPADKYFDILQISNLKSRAESLVDQKQLKKINKLIDEKEKLELELQQLTIEMMQSKTFKYKTISFLKRIFYQNQYFEKLFPSIKEQKPGRDLYALMATFQSILCIFMIFFFTKMDADVTNISDQLTYNQFSGQMVVGLFFQILVMILDRYLYKSKTFIQVQEEIEDARVLSRGNNQSVINESFKIDEFKSPTKQKQYESNLLISALPSEPIKTISFKNQKTSKILEQIKSNNIDSSQSSIESKQDKYKFENTKVTLATVAKYYLQIFLILLVHSFVFWYFPINGNIKLQNYPYCVTKTSQNKEKIACNEFGDNWALVIFYILYCCYFWISALQIRYGVAELKKGNFLMNSYHIVNYVAFKGFMAIPFIFELKTFIDWTFTKTALDVFQWFNLSQSHAELYIAHSLQGRMQRKPLGRPVQQIQKVILGFFGQVIIILLIAGPLLLFSTFNPISTPDPVINAQIQFNILLEPKESSARNTINVFTNNYVTTIKQISDAQYDQMKFAFDPKTKSFDKELIQFIKMNNFPDTSWGVSQPNKAYMREEFQAAMDNNSDANIYFQLQYEFIRQKQTIQPATADWVYNMSEPIFRGALKNFTQIFNLDCQGGKSNQSQQVSLKNIFTGVHFLNDYDQAIHADNQDWMKGLYIVYSCKGDYWTVDQLLNSTSYEAKLPTSKQPGIAFFTFSAKTSPSYFKYSVITFYLSIVLVIGKLLRNVLVIGGNRIFIFEIPRAESLLQLCECIYIYRMRAQLDKEEQLYLTFMDIMRSPEMIKAITGSALKKKAD